MVGKAKVPLVKVEVVEKHLKKYTNNFIEPDQIFLKEKSCENIYGLPKIHKSKIIEAQFILQNKGSRGGGT